MPALLGHAELNSRFSQSPFELGADPGILLGIRDTAPAFLQVGVVRDNIVPRLPLHPPVAAGDGQHPKRFLADAEMLVKPIAAAGSGCHHSPRHVVLPLDQVPLSSFPWTCAQLPWPSAPIAFTLNANKHHPPTLC